LVVEDSIEAKILQLQDKKLAMTQAALATDPDSALGKLTEEVGLASFIHATELKSNAFRNHAGHAILIPSLRLRHDSTRPLLSNYCHFNLPGIMYRLLCLFTRIVLAPNPSFICRDLFVALSFYTYYELVCFACFVISR
jgi:hypothetical protein